VHDRPDDHVVGPAELRARVRSRKHARRTPSPRTVAFGLAAVLVVLLSGVAAVGLATKPSGDAGADRSPASTTAADLPSASSPSGTPLLTPTATGLAPSPTGSRAGAARYARDSFVTVATDDLRVRSKPGVAAGSVKLEPLLWRGAIAFVLDGPVAASGYEWYLIAPIGEADVQRHPDPPRLGWVAAAAKNGAPWLIEMIPACAENALGYARQDFDWPPGGLVGLYCHGSRVQKFVARIAGSKDRCHVTSVTPSWLDASCRRFYIFSAVGNVGIPDLDVALAPSVNLPALSTLPPGSDLVVNVTGQYDHPAAGTCRRSPGADPMPRELVILGCRSRFAVTSLTLVGNP
jgi:hypothetical protein